MATPERRVTIEGINLTFPDQIYLPSFDIEVASLPISHDRLEIRAFPNELVASAALADRQWSVAREFPEGAFMWSTGKTWLTSDGYLAAFARQNPNENPFIHTIGLEVDEYVGAWPSDPESFNSYHRKRVQKPLGIRTFHYIHGDSTRPDDEAARYDQLVRSFAEITMVRLGVDEHDGHIGFIRPGTPLETRHVHVATLTEDTIARDRQRGQPLHGRAITQGYNMLGIPPDPTVRHILFAAFGPSKGKLLRQAWFDGHPSPDIPVSFLTKAPFRPTVYLDAQAAAGLLDL